MKVHPAIRAASLRLVGMKRSLSIMNVYQNIPDEAPNPELQIKAKYAALETIWHFHEDSVRVFAPNIALTQRNTPFWRPW